MDKFHPITECSICQVKMPIQNLGRHIKTHSKIPKNKCIKCNAPTNNKKYCSVSCSNTVTKSKPKKYCLECNVELKCRQRKFCSNVCSGKYIGRIKQNEFDKLIENNFNNNIQIDHKILRKYFLRNFGNKCMECKITEWNNKPISMHLDHIDGNSDNCMLNNLQLLCPNCHSQQPTTKGGDINNLKQSSRNIRLRKMYKLYKEHENL